MAFDLENAVQQGFNRDIETNDWHVEAHDLEIKLGDHGGAQEFRILDDENVGVVVADSDGYLSIAGNMEVHSGHILLRGEGQANQEYITMQTESDEVSVYVFDSNPDGFTSGEKGSFGTSLNDGYLYINTDGAVKWERLALTSQIPNLENNTVTLQKAYDNDPDGGGATITTNATDGDITFTGTEDFFVTTVNFDVDVTGSISLDADTDSNFTVDSGNLIFEIISSGDIINRLDSPGSDFIIDQGDGSEFLRAESSANVLRLGDLSPAQIDVRVLSDMIVDGDLTVNGTTTYVNTEDLFVEDRLLRLNVGASPSFSGTTGIEMEVGSDGYVEFHWDDTAGRWEISIDRNTTPEAETFRPLPYLADSPPTLDLSDIGDDGFPTAGPNVTGAASINSNATNFPYSFGDYMTDDSVQAALEAIDAYFQDIGGTINSVNDVTLQQAYDNDPDGGNANIVTNGTDGAVVIAGSEKLQVTATGGIDLDSTFDQDGDTFSVDLTGAASIDAVGASNFTTDSGSLTLDTTTSGDVVVSAADDVDVDGTNILLDATSAISLDAAAASNFTTSAGALTLDGAGGVVLDGNGSNVTPAADDLDSLGAAGLGWTNIYMRNVSDTATVGLGDEGDTDEPNTTSGAHAIGTNALNFDIFGPDMTDQSVQAALEAIDGYLGFLSDSIEASTTTLQIAYDNDVDGGDATILTNGTDGAVVISGTEEFRVDADGGINLDSLFDMDGGSGDSFDVDVTDAGFHLDAYSAASNITVDDADLVVSTTTSGILTLSGAGGIVLDGTGDDVRPADDRVNSLGRADAGWADIYLATVVGDTTVALSAEGDTNAPNLTSGAHAVGTNSNNFVAFGPDMTDQSVQAALEAIDGYLSDLSLENLDTTYKKKIGLDIHGGVTNGNVSTINLGLSYPASGTGRTTWTVPVPADWDGTSDIEVTVVWSPSNINGGDVEWRLEARVLALTELVTTAPTNDDYTQTANGTADALQSTEDNLTISAASIETTDAIIGISVVRRADAAGDTFTGNAQVHLVHYNYNAQNIV